MPLLNPPLPTLRRSRRRRHPTLPNLPDLEFVKGDERALRIALVTEYYYPHLGGVCEHVHFFAREARRRGHHVDVITSHIPGAEEQPNVIRIGRSQPVYCNGSQARITIGWNVRGELRRALRRGRYDIVHVHSPLTPVLPILAIEEAECPVVGTFHTYFDRSVGYTLGRKFFQKRLDMLSTAIAVSNSTTVALNRYFDADWHIIPNGIDTDVFHPSVPLPPGMTKDVPSILFLGRFDPRNGLTTLIDSFRKVKSKGNRGRQAKLVVVGDGPLREHYYKQANGDKDITFVGAVLEGRPSYYAHSSVYACPTTKASFGITLLESMACETPVVCSDILGFRDVVVDGREALMHPCGDRDALADQLVRVLDDEGLAIQLGTTGRQNSLEYSWERVTSRVLDVYQNVLGNVAVEV
ncbi:MAG: glycosyltransferase family 4 protein [Gemmatimonadaceae bacterium]